MTEKLEVKTGPSETIKEIYEICFTEKPVRSSEAYASVPKGYRMAKPEEVAFAWKTGGPSFREALCDLHCAIWTDQKGLESSGPYKIGEKGNFVKIKGSEYIDLDKKDRSLHHQGPYLVALCGIQGKDYWREGLLDVSANSWNYRVARVAIVPIEKDVAKPSTDAELAILARKA